MRSVLSTDRGNALYKLRGQLIEPILATPNTTDASTASLGAAGRPLPRTEWRLIAATHNLVKLHQHFHPAPA